MDKIEHEGVGTYARVEISQDAGNVDQKVKWFLRVHKNFQTFVGSIFSIFFFPKFLFRFTFYQCFDLMMRVKLRN